MSEKYMNFIGGEWVAAFEQIKTVHEIAPVFLKNPGRIEAFFTLYFLAARSGCLPRWDRPR